MSSFFKWKSICGYQTWSSYSHVVLWGSLSVMELLPKDRAVWSNHVASRGRIKNYLHGDVSVSDPLSNVHQLPENILKLEFWMFSWKFLDTFNEGWSPCFLPLKVGGLSDSFKRRQWRWHGANCQGQVFKAWQLPLYFLQPWAAILEVQLLRGCLRKEAWTLHEDREEPSWVWFSWLFCKVPHIQGMIKKYIVSV